jgi:glycerophosphoryl diester phosphodiesterase
MEAWTIDDEAAMRKCIEMGVDAVTSNDIALLNRVLADMDLR